jgi:hypothetical protein
MPDTKPDQTPAADQSPVVKNSAAVRMMTRSLSTKKLVAGKGEARQSTELAKPSQKPIAGSGSKGPRRGASKGS